MLELLTGQYCSYSRWWNQMLVVSSNGKWQSQRAMVKGSSRWQNQVAMTECDSKWWQPMVVVVATVNGNGDGDGGADGNGKLQLLEMMDGYCNLLLCMAIASVDGRWWHGMAMWHWQMVTENGDIRWLHHGDKWQWQMQLKMATATGIGGVFVLCFLLQVVSTSWLVIVTLTKVVTTECKVMI